jgi:hypothetical protein
MVLDVHVGIIYNLIYRAFKDNHFLDTLRLAEMQTEFGHQNGVHYICRIMQIHRETLTDICPKH